MVTVSEGMDKSKYYQLSYWDTGTSGSAHEVLYLVGWVWGLLLR